MYEADYRLYSMGNSFMDYKRFCFLIVSNMCIENAKGSGIETIFNNK